MITVEFKDFKDMKDFARTILGVPERPTVLGESVPAPVISQTPAVPQVPVAPLAPTIAAPSQPPVLTSTVSYTLDDLARAAMTLMDAGHQGDLTGLLGEFGIDALPALPVAHYGAFATRLRGMGAPI